MKLVAGYDQSLTDCQAFVTAMDADCNSGSVVDISTTALLDNTSLTTELTCTGDASWCVGTLQTDATATVCVHKYLYCMACFTDANSVVQIRVQSNNMPNKCWESSASNPNVADYVTVDWTTTWNPNMTGIENYVATDFDTQDETESVLCDITRTANANMNAVTTIV